MNTPNATPPTAEQTPLTVQFQTAMRTLNVLAVPLYAGVGFMGVALVLLSYAYVVGRIQELAVVVAIYSSMGQIVQSIVSNLSPSPLQGAQQRRNDAAPSAEAIGTAVVDASQKSPVKTDDSAAAKGNS